MDDPDPANTFCTIFQKLEETVSQTAAGSTASTSGSSGNIVLRIFILLILILVNAFFAMSEIAIISLNDNKIQKLAEEGHKKAAQVVKLTKNSLDFLSTIQVGVTLAGFLASAAASSYFTPAAANALRTHFTGISYNTLYNICLVVITMITSFFSLVFGELAPKKIAMQRPEKISYKVVGILLFCEKLTKPAVKLLAASTNGVVRLLGFDPNADTENMTEEEILMMVDVGEEKGVIENTQKEMINNIFEFDDLDAGDIMTHRVDMAAIEVSKSIDEVVALAVEEGYSRIPVFEEDQDNIIGIIYVKDLLKYVGTDMPKTVTLRDIMREPFCVPESLKCGKLFSLMSEKHVQMAVVVDEYGGTAGIVTLEDLVETIVGNIQDEYDQEDEEISKINDSTFTVDGVTDIDEIDELTGVKLPEGDYDTLAGFIIAQLGFLPEDGKFDTVEYENLKFTVLSVEDRRIDKVKIEITPPKKDENAGNDDDDDDGDDDD